MNIEEYLQRKKAQRAYQKNKENNVYMLIVSYQDEMPIQLGVTDAKISYKREEKMNSDVIARYYEDGRGSYITYQKGEFVHYYEKPFNPNEKVIILYRPTKKEKASRDQVIYGLLSLMKTFINGRNKLLNEDPQIWGVSQEVINEHIRKNNIILFEIEKWMIEYCYTGV